MSRTTILVLAAGVLLALGAFGVCSVILIRGIARDFAAAAQQERLEEQRNREDGSLSAKGLMNEWSANAVSFWAEYEGKRLDIRGKVLKVSEETSLLSRKRTGVIWLEGRAAEPLWCYPSDQSVLPMLRPNQEIKLRGTLRRASEHSSAPELHDCEILE